MSAAGPEQDDAVDRRQAAAAALREIHRIIERDRSEEIRSKRLVALGTALLVGIVAAFVLWGVGAYPTPLGKQIAEQLASVAILSACVVLSLTYAWHLTGGRERPLRRSLLLGAGIAVVIVALFGAFIVFSAPGKTCRAGDQAAGDPAAAVRAYTWCLSSSGLSEEARAGAYRGRAQAHAGLKQSAEAVADYQALLKTDGTRVDDVLAYAEELLKLGRFDEVLAALSRPGASAQTHDVRGRAFLGMQRAADAADEFTASIELQPVNPLYYWHRTLALEAAGKQALAARDLEKCAALLQSPIVAGTIAALLPEIRAKLRQYGLQDRYRLPDAGQAR